MPSHVVELMVLRVQAPKLSHNRSHCVRFRRGDVVGQWAPAVCEWGVLAPDRAGAWRMRAVVHFKSGGKHANGYQPKLVTLEVVDVLKEKVVAQCCIDVTACLNPGEQSCAVPTHITHFRMGGLEASVDSAVVIYPEGSRPPEGSANVALAPAPTATATPSPVVLATSLTQPQTTVSSAQPQPQPTCDQPSPPPRAATPPPAAAAAAAAAPTATAAPVAVAPATPPSQPQTTVPSYLAQQLPQPQTSAALKSQREVECRLQQQQPHHPCATPSSVPTHAPPPTSNVLLGDVVAVGSVPSVPSAVSESLPRAPAQDSVPDGRSEPPLESEGKQATSCPEGEETCVVCMQYRRSYACVPCGHMCLCQRCAEDGRLNECPLCRKHFSMTMKIFA